jgi:multiple sugar transport system substrate-binding protein
MLDMKIKNISDLNNLRARPLGNERQRKSTTNGKRGLTAVKAMVSPQIKAEILQTITFLENFRDEVDDIVDVFASNPYFHMSLHLIRNHFEAKTVTPTSLISASRAPYATANRRVKEMVEKGLIDMRPRTATGKSFSMHPSEALLDSWMQMSKRIPRLVEQSFGIAEKTTESDDYYFGDSYLSTQSVPSLQVLHEPLKIAGGIRILVHGDPTFMVMDGLKRQFEQVIGTQIHQRAFSIDRLREEALKNAERNSSRYDIIAVDLPWIGEFAEKGVLAQLNQVLDIERLDPSDFHTAGWMAAHWRGIPYGVPSQTTPELLFYRKDLFAEAGLEPPTTTDEVLEAASILHDPAHGRYGVAWNAARGTALGHTFMLTCADFGQPVFNLREIAGGFDANKLDFNTLIPTIDSPGGLEAAEYLLELLQFSPPDILSMSWYERVRPYAAGKIAMAYGYTLLAPYFELDPSSPAYEQTGYLPHPAGHNRLPLAPVGGYVLGIPANLSKERRAAAAEALIAFTSPEAQKLYVQNGSRTSPRYSVDADPEVRRLSPIFETVDAMSGRDELQFWPRPPVPQMADIISICGQEFHDMLRGRTSPRDALKKAQKRAEETIRKHKQ